ncbi:hypothetical protein DL96DRAFT_1620078 [Flagelloscypha sp. PMI_526]|nr:hypothetical protein DL96DRAFT_1620078 [Flagelloscypha sp. PMI_526]
MSSCGNPNIEGEALMERRPIYDRKKDCLKCRERRGNVIVRHAVYCKECFHIVVNTKFRKAITLPKAKRGETTRPEGNLLLGFSGGLGSSVLLDLVHSSYYEAREDVSSESDPRLRPWTRAIVCYVEICAAFPQLNDRTEEMRMAASRYPNFDFEAIRLEDAFDSNSAAGVDLANEDLNIVHFSEPPSSDPITRLRNYLSALPTQTAVASAVQTLIRVLLLQRAKAEACTHVFFGTSLTSVAVNLISSISQGGGFTVREEAEEVWTQPRSKRRIILTRPLRDIGSKECAYWAWWMQLPMVGKSAISDHKQSIGTLTKDFIIGLERDYPSTVSTITKTCAKLAPKKGTDGTCLLCQRPAQQGVQEWKARISIRTRDVNVDELAIPAPASSLTPFLCYACHTTLTSRSSRGATSTGTTTQVVPPSWAISAKEELWVERRLDETAQRAQVAEFLLDDAT